MERTIEVGNKPVRFRANAGTVLRYKAWLGRDLLLDAQRIQKAFESEEEISSDLLLIAFGMAYTMARQADNQIPKDMMEWLDEFDTFPVSEVTPAILTLWGESIGVNVEEKKVEG